MLRNEIKFERKSSQENYKESLHAAILNLWDIMVATSSR